MEAEVLILDDSSQREVVKQLSQAFPSDHRAVLAAALIVEAIVLSDRPGLMISSQ